MDAPRRSPARPGVEGVGDAAREALRDPLQAVKSMHSRRASTSPISCRPGTDAQLALRPRRGRPMLQISWAQCAARSVAFTLALISIVAAWGSRLETGGESAGKCGRPVVDEVHEVSAVGATQNRRARATRPDAAP